MSSLFRRSLNDAQLALLSLFLRPCGLDNRAWQQQWTQELRRPYGRVIQDFVKRGLLTQPGTDLRISIGYRVVDLKPILKRHGLKVSGRKADLIARLVEAEPAEAERLAAGVECFVCTETGAELAQAWKDSTAARREEAEQQVRAVLERGQARKAGQIADRFRDSLPAPMDPRYSIGVSAGGGGPRAIGANVGGAEAMLAITSAPGMSGQEVAEARVTAAEDVIWGRSFDAPEAFKARAYTELFRQSNQATLGKVKGLGLDKVGVLAAQDSCESCRRIEAEGPYSINRVPELPNPDCTHSIGWCRCSYSARFD